MATISGPQRATPTSSSEFAVGLRASAPVIVAVLPFALLFGAVAVRNGMSAAEATSMSALIFGGASQMVGIDFFGHRIAPWIVVLSIFAVNFRHVLYSATFGRRIRDWKPLQQALGFFFLTDVHFAETERRVQAGHPVGFPWYLGLSIGIYVPWVAASAAGALFGHLIGDTHALGIDFLLPIYFLGIVMEFHKRPLFLPVVAVSSAASILALHTIGSPWHVSFGAIAGIAFAAAMPARPRREASAGEMDPP